MLEAAGFFRVVCAFRGSKCLGIFGKILNSTKILGFELRN